MKEQCSLTLSMQTLYRLFDSSTTRQARPVATVGVPRESTLPLIAGLTAEHFTRRLSCLSLWAALQVSYYWLSFVMNSDNDVLHLGLVCFCACLSSCIQKESTTSWELDLLPF
jgi:hypothetical protein